MELSLSPMGDCCGIWELEFSGLSNAALQSTNGWCDHDYQHPHHQYDSDADGEICYPPKSTPTKNRARLLAELKELSRDVSATSRRGFKGAKGCGIIFATLIVRKSAVYSHPTEDVIQTDLIPILKKLGFKPVRTFFNPRSGCTLRTFQITGRQFYAALNRRKKKVK